MCKYFKILTFPNQIPKKILKNKKLTIGYDPKLFTNKILDFLFNNKTCNLRPINKNLIDKIWKRKIYINKKKFFKLPNQCVGEGFEKKISKITNFLKKKRCRSSIYNGK